jgi:hypothetical protein
MNKYLGKFTYSGHNFEMSVQEIGGGVHVELSMDGTNVISETVPLPMLAGLFIKLPKQSAWKLEGNLIELFSKRKEE